MKKQVRISILSNILNSKRNAPLCHGQRKLKTCAWSWFMAALAGSLVFPSADRSQRRALCTLPAFRSHTGEIEQALYSHAAGGISAAWTLADRGLRYPASGSITSASYPGGVCATPGSSEVVASASGSCPFGRAFSDPALFKALPASASGASPSDSSDAV